jgi:hypothetical protein
MANATTRLLIALALVGAASFTFSACGSAGSQEDGGGRASVLERESDAATQSAEAVSGPPTERQVEARQEPSPAPALVVELKNAMSFAAETTDGYTFTAETVVSDWIRGSDSEMVAAAWAAAGGNGSFTVPTIAGGIIAHGGSAGGGLVGPYDPEKAAILFGRATLTNTTSGFSLPEGFIHLSENVPNVPAVCIDKRDGLSCTQSGVFPAFSVDPGKSHVWPFAVIVVDAFTPHDPDGDAIAAVSLSINSEQTHSETVTPGKSW